MLFQNGVMTALPYLAMYLLSFPFGYMSDLLPNKGWLSITTTRKLSNSIGMVTQLSVLSRVTMTTSDSISSKLSYCFIEKILFVL